MTDMQNRIMAAHPERIDLNIIAGFVTPGARVLDVGCGDGALLQRLEEEKQADGRGIELSQKGVNEAVARGLSVVQGDADHDLATYPDDAFDFVILSQTLQATHNPRIVLEQLLRIGRKVVVSFPNFGNWRIRRQFLLTRPHADHRGPALQLVRHAEHPLLHGARLHASGRGGRRAASRRRWRSTATAAS